MNKTAIILFADLPDFEARSKRFSNLSSQKSTRKISSILTQHFYALAKETTADAFLIDTFQQKGKNFGEKIANAFAMIYAKGFENVVCIGNDCPDLDLSGLQNAIVHVEAGSLVLGPTFDGGAYLIGIPKQKFDQHNFQHIRWQNSQTFQDLAVLFQDTFTELPFLADVDDPSDFSFVNNENSLFKRILNLINNLKVPYQTTFNPQKPMCFLVDFSFLKGPPRFSLLK